MEHIRIFRSVLGSPRTPLPPWKSKTNPSLDSNDADSDPSNEAEYDSDEINAKGAMNHSRLQIVKAFQLVEPGGWYLGRQYYVVTRGSDVGVFHQL